MTPRGLYFQGEEDHSGEVSWWTPTWLVDPQGSIRNQNKRKQLDLVWCKLLQSMQPLQILLYQPNLLLLFFFISIINAIFFSSHLFTSYWNKPISKWNNASQFHYPGYVFLILFIMNTYFKMFIIQSKPAQVTHLGKCWPTDSGLQLCSWQAWVQYSSLQFSSSSVLGKLHNCFNS